MAWDDRLAECEGFDWDTANATKIWERHQVTPVESEEVFFNRPMIVGSDERHSASEERLYGLGQTDAGRLLFIVFTIRGRLVRVISARDMSTQGTKGVSGIMKKAIPKFRTEDSERDFWASHESTDYIDWRKARRSTLPDLKPSSQTISLRLPKPMLERLKTLANKRDVPYQSLLKMFIAERLKKEFKV